MSLTASGESVEREARRLRLLLDSINEGVLALDCDGVCDFANDAAGRMLGYEPGELVGKKLHPLVHRDPSEGSQHLEQDCPALAALRTGVAGKHRDDLFCRADGTTFPVQFESRPVLDRGDVVGVAVTFRDITERKLAERFREDYIGAISHDLRTPLTVILGHAQILEHALAKSRVGARRRFGAEAIAVAARQMNTMIRDLADSARLEVGQLELRCVQVDLVKQVQAIKSRLEGILETERIRVVVPVPVSDVLADPDRLERIVTNLFTNALKYSDPGSEVLVTVDEIGTEAVISVKDRGPGIPPQEMPLLFERYKRGKSAGQRRDSLGLGLYVTKGLVEAHGGRIWVESEPGVGSTFHVALPIDCAECAP